MESFIFLKIFNIPVSAFRGDTLVMDRLMWLKKNLPKTKKQPKILDVGCGNGAFSFYVANKKYDVLGLTWDKKEQRIAKNNARKLKLKNCNFEVCDVRLLDRRQDLKGKYDIIICTENIEHIINDEKLMTDMNNCLKSGGILLLTTPSINYIPISKEDKGPFKQIEDGGHVRKGYSAKRLKSLCLKSGFTCEKIDFCGGFLSQKITFIYRKISLIKSSLAWVLILPLRILPLLFDKITSKILNWQGYSICMVARKN